MIYTREIGLAWLAGAGFSPDSLHDLLSEEPDPLRMLDRFQNTGHLIPEDRISDSVNTMLRKSSRGDILNRWTEIFTRFQIHAMTFLDSDYPSRLRDIPEAPAILFDQGDRKAASGPTLAMVGSRNASYKGLEATRKIAEQLSSRGIVIISGLAYGVDAAAHKGCIRGGSPTIAVLGCGLDQDYPRENASLRREILQKGGLILSEYPPEEKPLGWHFPWRNRIISGLGDGLALMEARIRSGSMTSVHHALNQGKDVFVYPGEAGNLKSEGNHQLLREGAIYFTSAEDILEDMGWLDKTEGMKQNNECSVPDYSKLPPEEQAVMKRLEQGEQSFDQLCEGLHLPAAQLNVVLSMLQIQGLIRAMPGKVFQLTE